MSLPLLIFDTNIVMDIWLGRANAEAVLLVDLAEEKKVELKIPGFVVIEFRGTALRWIREQRATLEVMRKHLNEWGRTQALGVVADEMRDRSKTLENELNGLQDNVEQVRNRLCAAATIVEHRIELHFKGDLRYLGGYPPDRPVDGIKDCRIYEAVLDIVKDDVAKQKVRSTVAAPIRQSRMRLSRRETSARADFDRPDARPVTRFVARLETLPVALGRRRIT
jgi:hypothetical protein